MLESEVDLSVSLTSVQPLLTCTRVLCDKAGGGAPALTCVVTVILIVALTHASVDSSSSSNNALDSPDLRGLSRSAFWSIVEKRRM